jgi:hypothetical protein
MLQQDMIKSGTLNLHGFHFACEPAIAEHKKNTVRTIAGMELSPKFPHEPGGLECRHQPQLLEHPPIVGQERLPDVEPRKDLLLQQQNPPSRPGKHRPRRRTSRPATYDYRVVDAFIHRRM